MVTPSGPTTGSTSRVTPVFRVSKLCGVVGVTTAATLWFVTVLGLCFGGGQIALGLIGLLFGILVLASLRPIELRIKQDRQGTLTIVTTEDGPTADEIRVGLIAQEFGIASCSVVCTVGGSEPTGVDVPGNLACQPAGYVHS